MVDYADIEDDDFRSSVEALSLTLPHASSVLPPALENFHDQLYYHLVAMESYTYDHSEQPKSMDGGVESTERAGVTEYQPFWDAYAQALSAYDNHSSVSKQKVRDFIIGFYCFLAAHKQNGMGSASLIDQANARDIFNMDGHIDFILAQALEYFDDFIPGDPNATPEPTEDTAPNLEAATSDLSDAWDNDISILDSLNAQHIDVAGDSGFQASFGNVPNPPLERFTGTDAWDIIFDQSNWQWYINHFGTPLPVPPRPDPPPEPPSEE